MTQELQESSADKINITYYGDREIVKDLVDVEFVSDANERITFLENVKITEVDYKRITSYFDNNKRGRVQFKLKKSVVPYKNMIVDFIAMAIALIYIINLIYS
jgi:hypothetical protein